MDFRLTRRRRGTRVRRAPCPRTPAAFTSDDELLNASIQLFAARQTLVEAEQTHGCPREALRAARDEERAWTRYWHGSLRLVRPKGEYQARRPQVRMSQLVLPPEVARALDLAAVHARSARRLNDDWGLGELIPYGRGMSLLFSGLPGTGKTAAAEALAHRLDRPILAVDYSRIQNCFVGQTEKNIVRAFREAADQEAVLFWDEADAMFFDRDSARHNWEIRDVNVLLQQLERFDGVCILATNRKVALDSALQRRIALKIDFPRPDRGHRRQIWQRLLPRKLPLARDVDLDVLSRADFVGGEIKNIILNAARLALQRDDAGLVTMHDFQTAIRIEQEGGWTGPRESTIGFVP